MNWDDLRFVLAVADTGTLSRAAKTLAVDHTTVGRRIEAAEAALGVRLFTRTTRGYVPTADADRLIAPLQQMEEAVLSVERGVASRGDGLAGAVRVTSPETFGASYLSPRLAKFGVKHPSLTIELMPAGEVFDLGRRQAELAVRFFRSKDQNLVVRRVGEVTYGLYASKSYLTSHPLKSARELNKHRILSGIPTEIEARWLAQLDARAKPTFVSTFSLALRDAAVAGAGVAILPCFLGDTTPSLRHVKMPAPPREPIWLTVHRDLQRAPRVRSLMDFLAAEVAADAGLLSGATRGRAG